MAAVIPGTQHASLHIPSSWGWTQPLHMNYLDIRSLDLVTSHSKWWWTVTLMIKLYWEQTGWGMGSQLDGLTHTCPSGIPGADGGWGVTGGLCVWPGGAESELQLVSWRGPPSCSLSGLHCAIDLNNLGGAPGLPDEMHSLTTWLLPLGPSHHA